MLQALSRLDQAVSRIEAAVDNLPSADGERKVSNAQVRQAIAELDNLIQTLSEPSHG